MRTLDDQIGSEDTHGGDADARLRGAVGGTNAGKDDGGCATHGTEEGLVRMLACLPLLTWFGSLS